MYAMPTSCDHALYAQAVEVSDRVSEVKSNGEEV